MRLISICPSNTELAVYLGLKESLVGVDDYSDWPEEVLSLPRLGPDLSIDMGMVEELRPDLVLASLTVPGMEKNIEGLEERNIPYVIVPNPTTLTEVGDCLVFVGEATETKEKALELKEKYVSILDHYQRLSTQVTDTKTVYWEWWPKPIFTPGAENWLTEISELSGSRNVFQDKQVASVQTDWEDVRSRDPDVICVVWVGVQHEKVNTKVIHSRERSEEMRAIKNDQLYVLEEPLFCRPSPRLLLGLVKVASILHPTVYPPLPEDVDPLLDGWEFSHE
ncbi:cobalamin-binding protein [Salimicrobium flavidum]|uniref:Iron complex transport system substrate-binding protein n=1 Tax=Salimicrobium flavidum TaxID=570947 RepID=A0A1N7KGG3_9BACI|nr:cobalamin-binding protein [Salimicrobium flavidum]SIS60657.1 iron complex transport system substrate-binding protein [Salimicrobium flavidum]